MKSISGFFSLLVAKYNSIVDHICPAVSKLIVKCSIWITFFFKDSFANFVYILENNFITLTRFIINTLVSEIHLHYNE